MSRFDIFRLRADGALVVDVQAELLSHLKTRLVIPLFRSTDADWPSRLAPRLTWQGETLTLGTPLMIGIPLSELGERAGSLAEQEYEIEKAIDFLLAGV